MTQEEDKQNTTQKTKTISNADPTKNPCAREGHKMVHNGAHIEVEWYRRNHAERNQFGLLFRRHLFSAMGLIFFYQ